MPAPALELEIPPKRRSSPRPSTSHSQSSLTLRQLKALALRIAMDYFATGNWLVVLVHLRACPVDKFKVDGSFGVRSIQFDRHQRAGRYDRARRPLARPWSLRGLPVSWPRAGGRRDRSRNAFPEDELRRSTRPSSSGVRPAPYRQIPLCSDALVGRPVSDCGLRCISGRTL